MNALRGPVSRCEIALMHDGLPRAERPPATYLAYALPCETKGCDGRLICIGHAVCAGCAAAIRADLTMWAESGNDVELTLLHSAAPAVHA